MSAEAEARRLTIIGMVTLGCIALFCSVAMVNPFHGRPIGQYSVTMTMPYVGQGVATGTPLIMHGVKVGRITSVSSLRNGGVRLNAELQSKPTQKLTDTMGVDFRPANYFGVTALNLVPGDGGRPLRNGAHINTTPKGNFTLQALLSRLGEITGGVVTPQLVSVIKRATQYTDALNPLIETVVTAADSVAKVQSVSTERLLRNTAGISAAFPGFVDAATSAGYEFNQQGGFVTFNVSGEHGLPGPDSDIRPGQRQDEKYWQTRSRATLDLLANSFFGALGKLLSSHPADLLPAVGLIKTITDTVPGLVAPEGIAATLTELRTRYEKLYAGSPEQRALQVHIVLDSLPGVEAPVNAMGGP
ncbi:MlaD family protein [Mycobacterium avium]|jgi:hypothetical protein|nr:MlaD family protein [Mycobacterium avium]KBR61971.1 hypothetical protein X425_02522 [Mycobacterium avium XTB13-223]MBZ4509527.1 MCE family protein [Mycobacterium avium subsp. hominissuis]MBZ4517301.1 MCE family protein [Mycobacterium avium subsp. hominissuis]MBZ4527153.1 MCE family protein [Mycobacterium avium subsp. hominissuis]MBZ4546448.1 MCE family protein [Mycobacterium avium subsp. hominissuis]